MLTVRGASGKEGAAQHSQARELIFPSSGGQLFYDVQRDVTRAALGLLVFLPAIRHRHS